MLRLFKKLARRAVLLSGDTAMFICGPTLGHNRLFIDFVANNRLLQGSRRVVDFQMRLHMAGEYYNVLKRFHSQHFLRKSDYSYLEIGTSDYSSLFLAMGAKNVGVDPQPIQSARFNDSPKEYTVHLTTSDSFFEHYADSKDHYDLIFIDGLHTFEQAATDLVNVITRCSQADTDILIHDVIPINRTVANPKRETDFWTGDVYKIIYLLRELDVRFRMIDALPSGLLWLTGDQASKFANYYPVGDQLTTLLNGISRRIRVEDYKIQTFMDEIAGSLIKTSSIISMSA